MRCKKCKKEAYEGRPLHFSEIFGINRGKRSGPLGLNDRNGAKGVIRLSDCFLSRISVLPMERGISMETSPLLFQWDFV